MGPFPSALTFIVRVTQAAPGRVTGIVERARTGEKHRFDGAHALGELIVRMLDETAQEPPPADHPPATVDPLG